MTEEPRDVLGQVLARLGREVAEAAVDGDAHAPLQLGVGRDALVEPRIQVLAVALEAEDERLMVNAGGEVGDRIREGLDRSTRGRHPLKESKPDRDAQ